MAYAQFRYDQTIGNYFGMSPKSPHAALFPKLNKTLLEMAASGRVSQIYSKHEALAQTKAQKIKLSAEEKKWLAAIPKPLKIGNELDWPPFDFVKDGEPMGYTIDIVQLMAEKLGISIELVNGFTWAELVEKFKQGEIDVLPATYKTEERQKTMAFTKEYATDPSILIVKKSSTDIFELADLVDRKIATIEGYAATGALEKRHPRIKRILVKNVLEGLQKVSLGEADAFVGSLGVISYIMQQHFIPDIKIIGDSKLKSTVETKLHMPSSKTGRFCGTYCRKVWTSLLQTNFRRSDRDGCQFLFPLLNRTTAWN